MARELTVRITEDASAAILLVNLLEGYGGDTEKITVIVEKGVTLQSSKGHAALLISRYPSGVKPFEIEFINLGKLVVPIGKEYDLNYYPLIKLGNADNYPCPTAVLFNGILKNVLRLDGVRSYVISSSGSGHTPPQIKPPEPFNINAACASALSRLKVSLEANDRYYQKQRKDDYTRLVNKWKDYYCDNHPNFTYADIIGFEGLCMQAFIPSGAMQKYFKELHGSISDVRFTPYAKYRPVALDSRGKVPSSHVPIQSDRQHGWTYVDFVMENGESKEISRGRA